MDTKNPLVLEVAMEMALPFSTLEEISIKFGPDKARECAMSTSVGGIGPLLRDRIFGQSDQGMDLIGVSLLYENVWVQAWHEWGQLNLQQKPVGKTIRQVFKPTDLGFEIKGFDGTPLSVEVWEHSYGKAKVYFLACPEVTGLVYPGPKDAPHGHASPHAWAHEIRLKQSWVLGRGALTLCKKLNLKPDLAILSETPTIFTHHKLIQDEFQNDPFFQDTKYIFNDHTPLEYAHPIWDTHTLDKIKIDPALYLQTPAWNAIKKTLDITSLLVSTCESVFGVAKKHGEVMRAMSSLNKFSEKIGYITNGVRKEDWQAPVFAQVNSLSDEQLLKEKQNLKIKLINWVWRHSRLWPDWVQGILNKNIVIFTRRITPYKRLDVLSKLLTDPQLRQRFLKLNTVIFVGGRMHQQDDHAQDMVYSLLDLIEKEKSLRNKIIFIDNFNVWEAPILYQGADATIMMADDTREASATGFMKAQMNGAAVIATSDGAVPEFVDFKLNGFFIPYVNGEPTAKGLLEALEAFDAAFQDPAKAAQVMRSAFSVTPAIDIQRTVNEMKILFEKTLSIPQQV